MKEFVLLAVLAASCYLVFVMSRPQPVQQVQQVQQVHESYAAEVLPHIQKTFSKIDEYQGRLSDARLLQLREHLRQSPGPYAAQAARICDQLLPVLPEREKFRLRLTAAATSSNREYFKQVVRADWARQVSVLAPPIQRAYAILEANEPKSDLPVAGIQSDFYPIFDPLRP